MAALTTRPKEEEADLAVAAPMIALADRLSALPSDVLPQILSFLPVHEALRTCVLARTWRNLWKEKRIFPRRLLIKATAEDPAVQQEVLGFVDCLLDLRLREIKDAPLESCEISFCWFAEEDILRVSRWIRRALECQIQALRVNIWPKRPQPGNLYDFLTNSKPLASQNLTRLALAHIVFDETDGGQPDFSSCPALQDIELDDCLFLSRGVIATPSLKCLTIRRGHFIGRCYIRVPRLVSLCLEALTGTVPKLESMPELVLAYVNIGQQDCFDAYSSSDTDGTDDDDSELDSCDDVESDTEKCVFLGG